VPILVSTIIAHVANQLLSCCARANKQARQCHQISRIRFVGPRLRALVEIRVSQTNGCVYCVDLHTKQARHLGEAQQRLDTLPVWHESPYFDERERAALAWAEALTHISETHAPDADYNKLAEHFSEKEIVDLTIAISLINAWNRISIGFRKLPD
jgi:AhpD family alkylhydroperoxidase